MANHIHIRVRRMSDYVKLKIELTAQEEVHLSGCDQCLKLFRSLIADAPPDAKSPGRSRKLRALKRLDPRNRRALNPRNLR